MDFEKHKLCNASLGAPSSWEHDKVRCESLPVRICEVNGLPVIESFWRPSAEELEALNARGCVVLQIFGPGMPPVAIGVLAEKD